MGDIADMIVEGVLCPGCGTFVGSGDGFPQYCSKSCAERNGFPDAPIADDDSEDEEDNELPVDITLDEAIEEDYLSREIENVLYSLPEAVELNIRHIWQKGDTYTQRVKTSKGIRIEMVDVPDYRIGKNVERNTNEPRRPVPDVVLLCQAWWIVAKAMLPKGAFRKLSYIALGIVKPTPETVQQVFDKYKIPERFTKKLLGSTHAASILSFGLNPFEDWLTKNFWVKRWPLSNPSSVEYRTGKTFKQSVPWDMNSLGY